MRLRLLFTALSLGLAALLVAGAANALSESYYLDQSNIDGYLADGTNYLKVTLADDGADILVTVELLSPLLAIGAGEDNFGIQAFNFNSTNSLSAGNISLPTSWSPAFRPPGQQGDGFGAFDVQVANTGMARKNPILSFSIIFDGDSIYDYASLSDGGASEGHAYFAAHVAGFADQNPVGEPVTSGWFGGVPEPSTALLLLGGLSGLVVWRRRLH
jgi:hypothetical protein